MPHGLTQKPDFWAVKSLSGSRDWICYTEQVDGSLDFYTLIIPRVHANSSATAPTATTFGVYGNDINTAGEDQIAYLWHDVPGLQKFGKYEGGSNPYVELGFRPALVLFKNVDGTSNWDFMDAKRDPFNVMTKSIQPNLSNNEYPSEPGARLFK